MVEIKVYNDIAKSGDIFLSMFGMEDAVFSAETVKQIFADNSKEREFKFNIHCDGGSVSEGLAIYDIIRTSGKKNHCNIEGNCHSMAVTLLLAAPKENRTANKNCRALIHRVRAFIGDDCTAEELQEFSNQIKQEENAILDIYEERTGTDRKTLEKMMKAEKTHTSQELLDYGFISKINSYTVNKFSNNKTTKKMATPKKSSLANRAAKWLLNTAKMLAEIVNYDFTDADGNVLFSTEREDDTLEVGDAVTIPDGSTDGTFELEDGRTVTVAEGVITEITEPGGGDDELENLRTENANMRTQLEEAQAIIQEQSAEITNLKNKIGSNYTPTNRQKQVGAGKGKPQNAATKEEMRERINKFHGKKGA